MKRFLSSFIIALFITQIVIADSSTSYNVDISTLNGGGTLSSSSNYKANETIIGFVNGEFGNSANYQLGSGLVYLEQLCGNNILEFGEQCDDGNLTNGDGCSSVCLNESAVCGNGAVEGAEQCDDGNTNSGDGCSNICANEVVVTPGGGGGGGGGGGSAVCGNGIKQGSEQCDDGNNQSGDGCSALCRLETTPPNEPKDEVDETDEELKESAPDEPTETPEELDKQEELGGNYPLRDIKIKAWPEKRVNAVNNRGNPARVIFYHKGLKKVILDTNIEMNLNGWSLSETNRLPDGEYDISLKGLSHLTKVIRNITIDSTTHTIDFTQGETFYVIAGDVHKTKDDFINGLDISATVDSLYTSDIHADLNRDGFVNGLDVAIVVENIYKTGERR